MFDGGGGFICRSFGGRFGIFHNFWSGSWGGLFNRSRFRLRLRLRGRLFRRGGRCLLNRRCLLFWFWRCFLERSRFFSRRWSRLFRLYGSRFFGRGGLGGLRFWFNSCFVFSFNRHFGFRCRGNGSYLTTLEHGDAGVDIGLSDGGTQGTEFIARSGQGLLGSSYVATASLGCFYSGLSFEIGLKDRKSVV